MKRRDPVTPELRHAILLRDRGCIAPKVCGCITSKNCDGRLTLDHIREHPMMGKRAPSDERHLVVLCSHHHLESGWATAHRPEIRGYLRGIYGSMDSDQGRAVLGEGAEI